MNNLRQITGSSDNLPEMAREVFRNFGRYLVDFFFMYQVNEKFVRERVRMANREVLSSAISRGRGVIILAAHIGNWEMGAAVLTKMGYKLTAIALPHKQKLVNGLFNSQRLAHGVRIVPTSTAVRHCIQALKRGELVALLGDRDFGSFGEPLMFLGRSTQIPKGPAFFSLRTGAPVIPSFLIPDGSGGYDLTFADPVYPPSEFVNEDDVLRDMMRSCLCQIEAKIRENPTQWLMFREFGLEKECLYSDSRP